MLRQTRSKLIYLFDVLDVECLSVESANHCTRLTHRNPFFTASTILGVSSKTMSYICEISICGFVSALPCNSTISRQADRGLSKWAVAADNSGSR